MMDSIIFKASHIRGIYPDQIDEEAAWKIGYATARFLPSLLHGYQRGQANAQSLCVGRDMRADSEALAAALIEGINACSVSVIDIGMVDTPQMYFAINHLGTCGGVQVTAGHHPAKYNGFKISGLDAKPVAADTGLKEIQYIAAALPHTRGKATGSVQKRDLTPEYKNHILRFLTPHLRPVKIAVDASNGMAGKMVPAVFQDLPVQVIPRNFEHKGKFRHEPNTLVEKNLDQMKAAVKRHKCDFGICFDGDADRLIMVDQEAATIACDLLTALMAPYFLKKSPNSAIVYDLCSSLVVPEEIVKYGGTPRRERANHPFMTKALRDSHAVFGGTLAGRFYYRDNFYADSALLTLVHLLNIINDANVPLSELANPLRRYYGTGRISFKTDDTKAKMDELAKRYSDGQIDNLGGVTVQYKDWWFNCRPSNTEPLLRLNVEAKSKELLDEKLAEIQRLLGNRA